MQCIFRKENVGKARKYRLYRHLTTFEKIIKILMSFYSKKLRIAGTADMDKEYENYLFHVKGDIKGIMLGNVISLLSACIIYIVSII